MSIYFLADAQLFGIIWLGITLLSMKKNGWLPPYTCRTFDRDYAEVERLVQRFSLLRFAVPEHILHVILMLVPAFHLFLDLGGIALVILFLDTSLWVKLCATLLAVVLFIESPRRAKAFSLLVRGHLQGKRITVLRRYRSMFGEKVFMGSIADFGKLFMAIEIILWT